MSNIFQNSVAKRLLASSALMIATSSFAAKAIAQQTNNLPACNGENQGICMDAKGNIYASSDNRFIEYPQKAIAVMPKQILIDQMLKTMRADAKEINLLQSKIVSVEQAHQIDYANAGFSVRANLSPLVGITPTGLPPGKYKLGDLPIHQTQFRTKSLTDAVLKADANSTDVKKVQNDAAALHDLLAADRKVLQKYSR